LKETRNIAIMSENEDSRGNRLYPSLFGKLGTRYYYLHQLRKKIEETIGLYLKNGSEKMIVADYGCGNKPYKSIIAPHAKEYIGIDLPENKDAEIHVSDEGNIEMADSEVDIVFSTQVLEHVTNPTHYLAEARRILKDDGHLILSTHGYWMFHPDPTDYWRWTSMGLKKVITESGFEVVYFKGIIGRAAMGLQLFQDGIMFKLPRFAWTPLALFMQPLIILFDKITNQKHKDDDACTYIVVARKIKI
jgi:SAM-dependent methyltransferase